MEHPPTNEHETASPGYESLSDSYRSCLERIEKTGVIEELNLLHGELRKRYSSDESFPVEKTTLYEEMLLSMAIDDKIQNLKQQAR